MLLILVTELVFHVEMLPLNADAHANMADIVVADDTFQPDKSSLKAFALLRPMDRSASKATVRLGTKTCEKLVRRDTSHVPMGKP
jgi:hypothetical protein